MRDGQEGERDEGGCASREEPGVLYRYPAQSALALPLSFPTW